MCFIDICLSFRKTLPYSPHRRSSISFYVIGSMAFSSSLHLCKCIYVKHKFSYCLWFSLLIEQKQDNWIDKPRSFFLHLRHFLLASVVVTFDLPFFHHFGKCFRFLSVAVHLFHFEFFRFNNAIDNMLNTFSATGFPIVQILYGKQKDDTRNER